MRLSLDRQQWLDPCLRAGDDVCVTVEAVVGDERLHCAQCLRQRRNLLQRLRLTAKSNSCGPNATFLLIQRLSRIDESINKVRSLDARLQP